MQVASIRCVKYKIPHLPKLLSLRQPTQPIATVVCRPCRTRPPARLAAAEKCRVSQVPEWVSVIEIRHRYSSVRHNATATSGDRKKNN